MTPPIIPGSGPSCAFAEAGNVARSRTHLDAEAGPEEPVGGEYRAEIVVVDRVVDAASGTFGVRLTLPNPNNEVLAGLRCRVDFGLR